MGRVLRLGINDAVTLFDEDGKLYYGNIIKKSPKKITVSIIKTKNVVAKGRQNIILAQAVPKAKKMDFIAQKSTELGVSGIIPFFSKRCVPKWDREKSKNRIQHLRRIVIASAKQSCVRKIPFIEDITDFSSLIKKDFSDFLKIIFWEAESEVKLKSVLQGQGRDKNVVFVVGPEGGFTAEEITEAEKRGFLPVSLGDTILRTETVSITILSAIQYERGMFG